MNLHLTDKAVQQFIRTQTPSSVEKLIFRPSLFSGVSNAELLYQVKARAKLLKKQPEWAATEGLILAAPKAIEQCSSQLTALYKAEIANSLLKNQCDSAADLSSGFGVDTHAISKYFKTVSAIESDPELVTLSKHNFSCLKATNVVHLNTSAALYLKDMPITDYLFVDPDRRDASGIKRIGFEHYSPNIIEYYAALLSKARLIGIKVSPMIDLTYAEKHLPDLIRIDLISVENELKELVLWLSSAPIVHEKKLFHAFLYKKQPNLYFESPLKEESTHSWPLLSFEEANYLIDLAPAFIKSKRVDLLLAHDPRLCLGPSGSALLTSKEAVLGLPGRVFKIEERMAYSKNNLKKFSKMAFSVQVKGKKQRADEVRKAYGLKESEYDFLFILGEQPGLIIRATKVNN